MIFVILILFLIAPSSPKPLTLECTFDITSDNFYACTNLNLLVDNNGLEINTVNGHHLSGRNDESVMVVYFQSGGMKRLPRGVFKVFKNLKKYIVQGLDTVGEFLDEQSLVRGDFHGAKSVSTILIMTVVLQQLREKVFEGAENLSHLTLEACRIKTIDRNAFQGLRKLQSLGIKFNYITALHPDTFSDLAELQHLLMSGNYIKLISQQHFKSTKKLQRISLVGNLLSEVDPNVIKNLQNLEHFYLNQNACIDSQFGSDGVPFSKFKSLISKCTKENSHEAQIKKQLEEMNLLEKEIQMLQQLVEKYKANHCAGQSGMGSDVLLIRKNERPH